MQDKARLFRQFEKLGDMLGDGLHLEDGGEWIEIEYNKLLETLQEEIK